MPIKQKNRLDTVIDAAPIEDARELEPIIHPDVYAKHQGLPSGPSASEYLNDLSQRFSKKSRYCSLVSPKDSIVLTVDEAESERHKETQKLSTEFEYGLYIEWDRIRTKESSRERLAKLRKAIEYSADLERDCFLNQFYRSQVINSFECSYCWSSMLGQVSKFGCTLRRGGRLRRMFFLMIDRMPNVGDYVKGILQRRKIRKERANVSGSMRNQMVYYLTWMSAHPYCRHVELARPSVNELKIDREGTRRKCLEGLNPGQDSDEEILYTIVLFG